MQRTRLYLARHGQVEGFEERRYNGQSNVPLTPLGREQSASLSDCLADIPLAAIYSSDLDRSSYCAGLLADRQKRNHNSLKQLRELHFGVWEGKTWQELQQQYPEDWQARLNDLVNYRVPGGESLLDAAVRIRAVIKSILARHAGDNVALIAHGGVNRIILLDAVGAPLHRAFAIEQDYGCLNVIDYFADGNALVRLLNGTAHQERACAP